MAAGEDLYRLDRGAFAELDPTLVLTQDLCAVCAVDVTEVDDALGVPRLPGRRPDARSRRHWTRSSIRCSLSAQPRAHPTGRRRSWRRVAPGWLPSKRRLPVRRRGRRSCWSGPTRRSPLATGCRTSSPRRADGRCSARPGANSVGLPWTDIAECGAEVVIVAPCGFRLDGAVRAGRRNVRDAGVLPRDADVWAVDADAFVVRPGPRVTEGVETFAAILHPDRVGPPEPSVARRVV